MPRPLQAAAAEPALLGRKRRPPGGEAAEGRFGGASLVVAPQWIGDAVMTEPLLRRLHARGERLTMAAVPWVAPVYRAMPSVHAVIELPFTRGGLQLNARRELGRSLRGQFDAAYVLPNSFKSALLPFFASITRRVGYLGEMRFGLFTERLANPAKGQRPPMVAFYSALSGEAETAQDRPQLQMPPAQLEATLAAAQLPRLGYYVFAPGAEYGPAKRWPARHFAALATQLDAPVLLLGSSKEAALCEEIVGLACAQSQLDCRNLAGKTSLAEALGLIAEARGVISNDSGLMHVAAAFGVPQVAVFGSSSPLHTPPLNAKASVVWLKTAPDYAPPLDCSPCFERTCPLGHMRCLNDVSAERVFNALQAAAQINSKVETDLTLLS